MSLVMDEVAFGYQGDAAQTLCGVSLTIEDGDFVGLMGRTGCGKTTLIQLMAGLVEPSSGRVLLDGCDINARGYDRSVLRSTVGVVFQYPEYQLFESTVERDVAFSLKHTAISGDEKRRRVRWALEELGFSFDAVRHQSPLSLSGGEKRRVAIAGVLAAMPRILIFDEPIAGLDPMGRETFLALVKRLNREGTTILMISHNADALAECARRVIVLADGVVARDGTPQEVLADSAEGLSASASARIAQKLRERGREMPRGIVRHKQLMEALLKMSKEGKAI